MNFLEEPIRGFSEIKRFLPQREPMILVEALIYHDANKSISQLKIGESNIFVEDSVLTEAGLIENMAQTAALHVGYKNAMKEVIAREGYIAAIPNATIYKLPKLGETIETEIQTDFDSGDIRKVNLKTFLKGQLIASAKMTTILKAEK